MPPRKRLGQLLTELKVIDDHQLQSALGHQRQWGGKLGAILVQKGFCGEEQLVSALAQHLSMERVKLGETKIDPRAVKLVSKQIAEKLHVFPYQVSGSGRSEVISIAMSDPTDLSVVDQLAFHTGKRIKPLLASDGEIVGAIQANYGAPEEKKEATDKVARPPGFPPPPRLRPRLPSPWGSRDGSSRSIRPPPPSPRRGLRRSRRLRRFRPRGRWRRRRRLRKPRRRKRQRRSPRRRSRRSICPTTTAEDSSASSRLRRTRSSATPCPARKTSRARAAPRTRSRGWSRRASCTKERNRPAARPPCRTNPRPPRRPPPTNGARGRRTLRKLQRRRRGLSWTR